MIYLNKIHGSYYHLIYRVYLSTKYGIHCIENMCSQDWRVLPVLIKSQEVYPKFENIKDKSVKMN